MTEERPLARSQVAGVLSALAAAAVLGPSSACAQSDTVRVYAANLRGSHVSLHDASTGDSLGAFVPAGSGGLSAATGIAFGPDGRLYVGSSGSDEVLRFDGESGAFVDVFVRDSTLRRPFSLIFGPDGDLFVGSGVDNRVLRFDGATGAFEAVVADGLSQPIGLRFGPDGSLYVANSGAGQILRIDPAAGDVEVVVGAVRFPSDLVFGPGGSLYVTSAATGKVLEFDAGDGSLVREVFTLPEGGVPVGLDVTPDGALIVGDFGRDVLYRVDPANGTSREMSGGLAGPENLVVRSR